jgi:hypothetical protein
LVNLRIHELVEVVRLHERREALLMVEHFARSP